MIQSTITKLFFFAGIATIAYAVTIGPGSITAKPIGSIQLSVDPYTLLWCNFNQSTACLNKSGSVSPLKTTLSTAPGGVSNSNALYVPATGAAAIYPNTGINLTKGTIEAVINPTALTHKQYIFSMKGNKSLNGDDLNDLIFGETGATPDPNTSYIYFGTPSGPNLSNPLTFPTQVVRGISAGDVNGDHNMDLVISNNAANELRIFLGPFSEGQALSSYSTLAVPGPQGNILADLDNDGDLDIVAASYSAASTPVYGFKNDGAGNFTPLTFSLGPLTAPGEGLEVVDLNNDHILDIVFGSFTNDPFKPSLALYGSITNGNYNVSIMSPQNYQVLDTGILGVAAGDLNGDGWQDITLAQTAGNLIIRYNDGAGAFPDDPAHHIIIPTPGPFTLAIRDMDNDGYLDIATTNYKAKATMNNPSSTIFRGPDFTRTMSYTADNAVSQTIGDLNNDGLNDIVYHTSTGTNCPIHYLDINGNPTSSTNITCQSTYGNPGGPGSGVFAAMNGSTPYGRITRTSNSMQIYYDPTDNQAHFLLSDTDGKEYEVATPFTPNGGLQTVQAEWNMNKKVMRLFVKNDAGVTSNTVNIPQANTLEFPSKTLLLGTGFDNQYGLNGLMDNFRISNVERSQIGL